MYLVSLVNLNVSNKLRSISQNECSYSRENSNLGTTPNCVLKRILLIEAEMESKHGFKPNINKTHRSWHTVYCVPKLFLILK